MNITTKFSCGDMIWIIAEHGVEGPYTVGRVSMEYTAAQDGPNPDSMWDNYGAQKEKYTEGYMTFETGVGCGGMFRHTRCFATREKAEEGLRVFNERKEEGLLALNARDELAEMPEGD